MHFFWIGCRFGQTRARMPLFSTFLDWMSFSVGGSGPALVWPCLPALVGPRLAPPLFFGRGLECNVLQPRHQLRTQRRRLGDAALHLRDVALHA
ncbi:hypothetical protein M885DRAFT_527154 [Pelagophyceae sp. CCMP2097]|nr:hypothetical protein M885DRAFT_527154 [Pelagophyceae sp. CCMP2097]